MKTPLCEFCLKTSELCSGCTHRLQSGKLREIEVALSRVMKKYEEKHSLEHVHFTRAYDCGNIAFLFTSTNPGFLIGKGGKVISSLIKEVGKHIRVVKESNDFHLLCEEILRPVKPLHATSVFHDGKEATKMVVEKKDFAKLPAKPAQLEKLLSELAGKPIKMAFE